MQTRARTYRRAIGIVRVSEVRGREGESFASPAEQRERIEAVCEREGLRPLYVLDELDVSAGTPLDRRAGLRAAVEAIEAGDADVIVAAYFDRLVRWLRVQAELLEPDPELAPVIVRAFEMRAEREPIKAIRAFLAEHGIERSHHGVDSLLASLVVIGELHFGELVNRRGARAHR